jgi:hypothetical protein
MIADAVAAGAFPLAGFIGAVALAYILFLFTIHLRCLLFKNIFISSVIRCFLNAQISMA